MATSTTSYGVKRVIIDQDTFQHPGPLVDALFASKTGVFDGVFVASMTFLLINCLILFNEFFIFEVKLQ